MPIYDRTTKDLMHEFARKALTPGQTFTRQDAATWFSTHYPKIRPTTVTMHVAGMTTNEPRIRKHHPHIRPGANWDLFFKIAPGMYRLWDSQSDPPPEYPESSSAGPASEESRTGDDADEENEEQLGGKEFACERDLKNYLAKNLGAVEPGLKLFQDEGFDGVEYPAGGRFIDILAVDPAENFVVIELKVSRGYDRTIGQLLRYMAWVKANLAEGKKVRGVIVASDITEDLRLAASPISDVTMIEYELALCLRPVSVP